VIGMVGELPDPSVTAGLALAAGDAIALAGPFVPALAGSELAKQRGQLGFGLGEFDLVAVAAAIANVRAAVQAGRVRVPHDVYDGGLACAQAECAIAGGVGLHADLGGLLGERGNDPDDWLFGEGPGGFVLAGDRDELERMAAEGMAIVIGEAGGGEIELRAGDTTLTGAVADAERAWRSLGERLSG
jgi:phosphoribosylformylglycinamidine synthase